MDQRTCSHHPKPCRFLHSASRHSTLIWIACHLKTRFALNIDRCALVLPNWILEFVPRARSMARGEGMLIHSIHAQQVSLSGHQPRSNLLKQPALERKRGGLKERRPVPLLSYLDANAACQSTARGSENTLPPSKTAQVSPFGQPT